jgi:acyl carrier protein
MVTLDDVRQILGDVLRLGNRARELDSSTPLLGSIPELDSMAVISVITAFEERLGIIIEDDEISADTFESVGSLYNFVSEKVSL